MQRILIILIFYIVAIQVVSFGQNSIALHISPEDAKGGSSSQIFDSITFIPLQTTKESLFGKIYQLEITQNYFVIFDQETNAILFFKKNGKFAYKITPPAGSTSLGYFSIDQHNKKLIAITSEKSVGLFDLNGKFIEKKELGEDINGLYCFGNKEIAYNLYRSLQPTERDSTKYDIKFFRDYALTTNKQFIPYNAKYAISELNQFKSSITSNADSKTFFFSLPGSYNVYQLNDKGIENLYKFVFPLKYSLPFNFDTDSSYAGKRADYVYNNPDSRGKFVSIEDIYKNNDYLLFTTRYEGYFTNDRSYLYNLKSGNLISFGRVTGDSSSYFIPVLSVKYMEELNGMDGNYIYTSIPASILFGLKQHATKKVEYNTVLSDFFEYGSKNDNPVIICAKLKDNL